MRLSPCSDGWTRGVDCEQISQVARLAGAPSPTLRAAASTCSSARARRRAPGEPLYRIHGVDPADFSFAREAADTDPDYRVIRA